MTLPPATPRLTLGRAARWLLVLPAFPLAGLLALLIAGPTDSAWASFVGGLLVGLLVGAAQLFGLWGRAHWMRWLLLSSLGSGVGLLAGASTVSFSTELPALVAQGAIHGAVLGLAQAFALPSDSRRWLWTLGVSILWALGWLTTTLIGVDVETHYAIFGASGAAVVTGGLMALAVLALPSKGSPS